jgi:hypothetical protein
VPGAGVRARAGGGTLGGPGGGYPLMAVCRATKANGEPCTLAATGPQGLCWAHDPANRDRRRRMASKAARSKPNRELSSVKALLEDLTERVLSGDLETGRAAVANQLVNTRLRAIEQERKIRETEELAERLEALEGVLKGRRKA